MPRPRLPKRKISVSVTLEETTKKAVKKIGEGNMSKGIEMVYKGWLECQLKLKDAEKKLENVEG